MKLAVLMSTYNGELFLRQQIESILAQSCEFQVDLLVRDDGSSDRTHSILDEYARAGKLHWYMGENLKPAKSFLDLLQHSCGYDYYAFADQDDVWYPQKLQNGVNCLREYTGPAMSFANARLVDEELQSLGRNVYRNPPKTDFYSVTYGAGILGCTVVFNRSLAQLIQECPIPTNLIMHDYYLGIVCTLHNGTIVFDNTTCMDYRQHGHNVVGSSWKKTDALRDRIRQITVKKTNTVDKMADCICRNYPHASNQKKLQWLKDISCYKSSFFCAFKLATDRKPASNSLNMAITLRLSYLLRNR